MATQTTNYNLGKPEATDPFSAFLQLFNDNMDIIDTNMSGGGGTTVSLIPIMRSNSQDGYIARADSEFSSEYQAYMVFDSNYQTAWAPGTSGQSWVEIEMPSAKKATKFRITTRTGGYYASSIAVQGSNDGTTYTNLGSVSGLTSGETVEISNSSNTDYLIYRFVVDDFGLAEITIEGESGGGSYSAGDGIDITSNTISLAYLVVNNGKVCLRYDDGT